MNPFTCRFPTRTGPCRRAVGSSGDRCFQHIGLDASAAARTIANDLRTAVERKERQVASDPPTISDEQIVGIATCLQRHGVAYLVIGGVASQLHGAPVTRTRDADIVPAADEANLERLAAALAELEARLWIGPQEPDGVDAPLDQRALASVTGFLNLVTRFGPLDLTFTPDGTDGYDDLVRSVVTIRLLGVDVPVASLDDVIRSKEAAGRAKDIAALPILIAHRRSTAPPA